MCILTRLAAALVLLLPLEEFVLDRDWPSERLLAVESFLKKHQDRDRVAADAKGCRGAS